MTPEQKAFEAALKERLADRARLLLATDQDVIAQLQAAKARILEQLAAQPSDFNQWRLPQLLAQIQTVLDSASSAAAGRVDAGLRGAWQAGEDFVDKPLAAAGINIAAQLPLLDTSILVQLRAFAALRLKDVGAEAVMKIGRQLSLATIGGQTPFDAIRQIQALLGHENAQRATTIVRTEMGRAFALANQQRLGQAADKVPGLQKQWRRSGKIHSRWNHDAIDGQVVDADKPFTLPSHQGPVQMMHPHDPAAPAEEVINCFLPGTRVQGRMQLAFRMKYQGPAIEVITRSGFRLAVTPNHPILTPLGFVAAKTLQQGQHLVCHGGRIDTGSFGVPPIKVDEQHPEASIEEVFRTLSESGTLGLVRAAHDFHNDALFGQENIEVVGADGRLLIDAQAMQREHQRDLLLESAGVAAPSRSGSGALALSQSGVPASFPSPLCPLDLIVNRPRPSALDVTPYNAALFGDAADIDASIYKQPAHNVARDIQLAAELLDRHSGRIFADEVIAIREFEFSGHVYDVRAEGGWIVADGIVSSNCGCIALPFKSSWQVATPGARPFTDLELQLDPRKAQLDQAAKRAGLRKS